MVVISEEIRNRKGASKTVSIPEEVINLLNEGVIESVNLTEWLAVNHALLLEHVFPTLDLETEIEAFKSSLESQKAMSGMKAIRTVGELLDNVLDEKSLLIRTEIITKISNHTSDSVRCWAAFINKNSNDSLKNRLSYIQRFAADNHFGVREISWMAIREDLSRDIDASVPLLIHWAQSTDENLRRFSVESIRPRGVWCKHIDSLKQDPSKGLAILEILKGDTSKYVQDSVGNWLNDASKTQPEWVLTLCHRWELESKAKSTSRIIKRATRTIVKSK